MDPPTGQTVSLTPCLKSNGMKTVFFLMMLLPLSGFTHPGVGIVKDSKGNIFYTDLKDIWKISGGVKQVVVFDVHSHELYIDKYDNLFGEGGDYNPESEKFYHYLWVYRRDGQLDTVIGRKEAYVHQDFSLARDRQGNEYYTKRFLAEPDTSHIYRKSPDGHEIIYARGNFNGVKWLHPQDDGSLLYVSENAIYRVDRKGRIGLEKENVGNKKPSFKFSGNNITIWGVWQDRDKNIYAAVFSDQTVRRIDPEGNMTDVYKSTGNWTPLHGVFDNDGKLWVLEGSDKNDVRVTLAEMPSGTMVDQKRSMPISFIVMGLMGLGSFLLYFGLRRNRAERLKFKLRDKVSADVRR